MLNKAIYARLFGILINAFLQFYYHKLCMA